MKKLLKSILFIAATTAFLNFASCSNDDEENKNENTQQNENSSTSVLPASVGENPFTGKKYENQDHGNLVFTDKTVTEGGRYTYNYTYDTTKKFLYLSLISFKDWYSLKTVKSVEEYVNAQKTSRGESSWTADTEAYHTDLANAYFSETLTKKYEFSGDSLILTNYFTGNIPLNDELGSGPQIYIKGGLRLNDMDGSYNSSGVTLYSFPTFKDGMFTGNAYKSTSSGGYERVGIIKGSYTTSEPGIGSWYATFNFTVLPEGLTYIRTGKDYTLSVTSDWNIAPVTYTLAK